MNQFDAIEAVEIALADYEAMFGAPQVNACGVDAATPNFPEAEILPTSSHGTSSPQDSSDLLARLLARRPYPRIAVAPPRPKCRRACQWQTRTCLTRGQRGWPPSCAALHQNALGRQSATAVRHRHQVHRHRKGHSPRSEQQAHLHAAGSLRLNGAPQSPHKLLAGEHCVDDDDCYVSLHVANVKDDRGPVGTYHHREAVTEVPRPDWVSVRMRDASCDRPCLYAEGAITGSASTTASDLRLSWRSRRHR
jgi:hypothetical protein